MQNEAFRITVPTAVTRDVLEIIAQSDGKHSNPQPASSTADPLNAPVTGGDIQAAAEVITAVFASGSAALAFLNKLIDFSKKTKGVFRVYNTKKSKEKTITDATKAEDLMDR